MNRFTPSLLVFFAVVIPLLCGVAWERNSLKKDKQTYTSSINGVNVTYNSFSASWEVGNQDHCTISYYSRVEAINSPDTTPANNGVAQCTQQDCEKTIEPAPIDCEAAFGKNLSELEK